MPTDREELQDLGGLSGLGYLGAGGDLATLDLGDLLKVISELQESLAASQRDNARQVDIIAEQQKTIKQQQNTISFLTRGGSACATSDICQVGRFIFSHF